MCILLLTIIKLILDHDYFLGTKLKLMVFRGLAQTCQILCLHANISYMHYRKLIAHKK